MVVAGLVVLIVAALLILAGLLGGSSNAALDLGVFDISTNSAVVFCLGMVAMALVWAGFRMMWSGLHRSRAQRRDRKRVEELSRKLDQVNGDKNSTDGTDSTDSTDGTR